MNPSELCRRIRLRAEQLRAESFSHLFPANMKGMCAICTIALAEAFESRGWECRAYYGLFFRPGDKPRKHCWLEAGDLIYDLTATQFGDEYPAVFIVAADDPRYAVREWQVDLNGDYWKYAPEHQRPTKEWIAVLTRGEIKRDVTRG